jgi:hypothetical protein
MKRAFTLILFFLSSVAFAQNGIIKGIVKDKATEETIFGANVLIVGTTKGASSGIDGDFNFEVAPGIYDLKVTYIGYAAFTVKDLEVVAGQEVNLTIQLESNDVQLEEIVVAAKADRTVSSILTIERRKSDLLVQNIGAQELSRVGAGDAAEGLKKVVGLAVQGSKFLVVRGLGDRYNSSTLNGLPVASPNPDRRVLPFDIFPSNVIQNINVVKSFSPTLYGNFSGAAVNISTKDYPEDKFLTVGFSVSANTQTTFKDFLIDQSQSDDNFGFNSTREIPRRVLEQDINPNINVFDTDRSGEYTDRNFFDTKFDPSRRKAPVNSSYNITYGDFIPFNSDNDDRGVGIILNGNFGEGLSFSDGRIAAIQNPQGDFRNDFEFDNYNYSTNASAIANLALKLNENHQIRFNNLYTHLSENSVLETWGEFFDAPGDNNVYSRRITYKDYELLANQVLGEHSFLNEKLTVNWGGSISTANATEPDRRQLAFLYAPDSRETFNYQLNVQDRAENHRFFTDLQDEESAASFSAKYSFRKDAEGVDRTSLRIGADYRTKTRDYSLRQFNYGLGSGAFNGSFDIYSMDNSININALNNRDYDVTEGTQVQDTYAADLEIIAPFFDFRFDAIPDKLSLNLGLRIEDARQFIDYTDPISTQSVRSTIQETEFFPSLIAKYNFSNEKIGRLSFSRTISRPDFRELALFEYRENFGAFRTVGNPNLENGINYNLDLRYEKISQGGNLIAVGAFGKVLNNPIVQTVVAGSNPLKSFTNGQDATVLGLEAELRQNLGLWFDGFENFSFNTNLSVMYSEINVGDAGTASNNTRRLEGASPYLLNTDITYTSFLANMDYEITLAYNVFGRRLSNIGFLGLGDIFEMPVNTLNLNATANFGKDQRFKGQFYLRNILNPAIRIEQELLTDGEVSSQQQLNNFKRGMTVGLGLSYTIF